MKTTTPDARRATKVTEYLNDIGWELCDLKNLTCKKRKDGTVPEIPTSGIIEYQSVRNKNRDNGNKSGQFCMVHGYWDSSTSIVYGNPLSIGSDGKSIRFQAVIFDSHKILDMKNERDRREHYLMLHSPMLLDGVNYVPNVLNPAIFKLIDKEADSRVFVETRKLARQAEDIIAELVGLGEVKDFGMLFGINPSNTPIVVERQLFEIAANTPREIINRFNDPSRKVHLALKKGLHYGIVEQRPDGIFLGGLMLGVSQATAVDYLKRELTAFSGLEAKIHDVMNPTATTEYKEAKKPNAGTKKALA